MDWPKSWLPAPADRQPRSAAGNALFGLEREWQWLATRVAAAGRSGLVLYLYGPAGAGKTFLADHFAQGVAEAGWRVAWTSAAEGADAVQTVPGGHGGTREPCPGPVRRLSRYKEPPLLWVIDGLDGPDARFRDGLTRRLDGTVILFTGRPDPTRTWPGEGLRQRVEALLVADWTEPQAEAFLSVGGLTDSGRIAKCLALAGGRPGLLARALDSLNWVEGHGGRPPWALRDPSTLTSFLLEHLLHPGSRRLGWRAGAGQQGVDEMVAAGSLFPVFRRALLSATLARPISDREWDGLADLPFSESTAGGFLSLRGAIADEIEELIEVERPWLADEWRRRAVAWLADMADEDPRAWEVVWPTVVRLAQNRVWRGAVSPARDLPGVGWRCMKGSGSGLGRVEAVDGRGNVRGRLEWARIGNPPIGRVETLRADRDEVALGLVRAAVTAWWGLRTVRIAPELSLGLTARTVAALTALGFRREEDALELDLSGGPSGFIRTVAAVLRPTVRDPLAATRDLLAEFTDRERLAATAGYRAYVRSTGRSDLGRFVRWVDDALSELPSGGGNPTPACLLRAYYIDRLGPHELLAERLNVSRATYFRLHRKALQLLSRALFQEG